MCKRGVGQRRARELQRHLLGVVAVDMAVAAGPDEVAQVQVALLRHHVRQQRVAGDVEGHAEKDVGAALVELAAQLATAARLHGRRHVELEEGVAGHQRHLAQLGHVPGADDDAARVRVGLEGLDHFGDLVDVPAVRRRPAAPLHAIHRAQVAVGAGPFVPDGAATLLQPLHVGVAAQKPQQLHDDGAQVHLLGGDQRKAFVQVEAHLVAEHALGAGARAVGLEHAVGVHMAHEVFILRADGASRGGGRRRLGHAWEPVGW